MWPKHCAHCAKSMIQKAFSAWLRNAKHNGHTTFRIVDGPCANVGKRNVSKKHPSPIACAVNQSGRPRLVSISKFRSYYDQSIRFCRPLVEYPADRIRSVEKTAKGMCISYSFLEHGVMGSNHVTETVRQKHNSVEVRISLCRSKCNGHTTFRKGKRMGQKHESVRGTFILVLIWFQWNIHSLVKPQAVGTQQNKHQPNISSLWIIALLVLSCMKTL